MLRKGARPLYYKARAVVVYDRVLLMADQQRKGEEGVALTDYEKKVLAALDEHGAMMTSDVATAVRPMFGNSNRMHSAAVRSWLLSLEKQGLVRRLDNQEPVFWLRAALANDREA